MKSSRKNYRKNAKRNPIEIDRSLPAKRLLKISIGGFIILALLIIRIFWIQFIDGSWLKEKAYRQQTSSKLITPDRGSILDVNGKSLAISEKVDTISINPSRIDEDDKKTLSRALSDIFELEYEEVLEKVNSTASVETIIKKVETDKVSELETWMTNNKKIKNVLLKKHKKMHKLC